MKKALTTVVISLLCVSVVSVLTPKVMGWASSVPQGLHQNMALDALRGTGWTTTEAQNIAEHAWGGPWTRRVIDVGEYYELYYHRIDDCQNALHALHLNDANGNSESCDCGDRSLDRSMWPKGKRGGAEDGAKYYVEEAQRLYAQGNKEEAMKNLGYAIHFIQDATCPPHVFPFQEGTLGPATDFELYTAQTCALHLSCQLLNRPVYECRGWKSLVRGVQSWDIVSSEDLLNKVIELSQTVSGLQCSYVEQHNCGPLCRLLDHCPKQGQPPASGWEMSDPNIGLCMQKAASLVKGAAKWVRNYGLNAVDVVLVIDRSGSMSGTKLSEAKTSAKYFTDLLHIGDKIGVVTYETSTRIDYPLTKIESTNTKTLVKNKINQIYPGGVTAMGAGLRAAYNQLVNYGDQSHPWAIVLMSNGFHNYGEHPYNVLPALKSKNIKVYTIGLGAGADGNLLGKIATDTGGFYRYAAKPADLVAIYQAIAAIVTQEQTISSVSGSISQGATTQLTATIDSSVVQATYSISWGGSDLDLTLVRPDGSLIDPATASTDPRIEYIEEARYEMYRIRCPMMGTWTLVITGVSVPPGGESFVAGCAVVADIKLQMCTDKDLYSYPQKVQINATIEDWDTLILGANVEASVTRPDHSQINIILFDDGSDLHGDQVADDGVYTINFGQYTEDGSYTIKVTATGTASTGEPFLREAQKTVTVSGIPSDTTPPKTNLLIGPPQYIMPNGDICITSSTPFTLDAVDNNGAGSGVAQTGYRIYTLTNSFRWVTNSPPIDFQISGLDDGVYYLDYNSTDNAGNVEITNTKTIIFDNNAPSLTIETPAENDALQDGVTFKVSAWDLSAVASVAFSIQCPQGNVISPEFQSMPATLGAEGKWSLYFDTPKLPDGFYMFVANGTDVLGNWGTTTVQFSVRNWAAIELLPASETNKAGRTMPVKFSIRVKASVDPAQPFIRNEELTIKIYRKGYPETILQTSTYGTASKDYRIDPVSEKYITNFKTLSTPATYVVEIWRKGVLIGSFEFKTVK